MSDTLSPGERLDDMQIGARDNLQRVLARGGGQSPRHLGLIGGVPVRVVRDVIEPRPLDGYSPLQGFGSLLGIQVKQPYEARIEGPVFNPEHTISPERREAIGYGDLPDVLIQEVEDHVRMITPDHFNPDITCQLAAQVMHVVSDNHRIHRSDLDHALGERYEAGHFSLPEALPLGEIAVLRGIVDLTHEVTVRYFEPGYISPTAEAER
jgi:hypothetical protein